MKNWLYILLIPALAISCKKESSPAILLKMDIRVQNSTAAIAYNCTVSQGNQHNFGDIANDGFSSYSHFENWIYPDGRLGTTYPNIIVTLNNKIYQAPLLSESGKYTCKITYSASQDRILTEWIKE